jgi:hypothetical protein
MLKKASLVVAILSLLILAAGSQPVSGSPAVPPGPSAPSASAVATNLLVNGDFDQVGFYWRYPNHYVAGGWFEYWIGSNLPEFIDGGSIYHNACYPTPADGVCGHSNNHSQGYIRWGAPYKAGVYQLVSATPCASYNFSAWVRTDQSNYHPKVGIDVKGTQLPFPDQDDTSHNCPPNGNSPCPNPGISTLADMPQTIVWGPDFNAPYFTWTNGSVTAEALSTAIGVWTFVAPEECSGCSPSRSTYWDATSLVQVIPTTLSPDGRIPAPDGKISGLTVTPLTTTAQIQWTTSQPAFSQVFYRPSPPAPSCTGATCVCPPGSPCIVHTVYFPLMGRGYGSVNDFTFKTVPTAVPTTSHSVSLTGLEAGTAYDFVVMSRAFTSGACVSSVSSTGTFTTTTP